MKVEKTVITKFVTTDNKEFNVGDEMIFETKGLVATGIFKGVGKKGSLIFTGREQFHDVEFHISPAYIGKIYIVDDFSKNMNLPFTE